MANTKNLTPFKKGQSGNPNGRPKTAPELKDVLADVLNKKDGSVTTLQKVLTALANKAIKGDVRAAQELLDRYYGKPTQFVNQSTEIKGVDIKPDQWVAGKEWI